MDGRKRRALQCKWASCPLQDQSFPSPEELALHVEESHVNPCASHDLFICQWEGCKVYNRPSYSFGWLQRHVKQKHTKERPNKCLMNGCNMSFNSVDALQKHMLRHFESSPPTSSPPKKSKPSSPSKASGSCCKDPVKEPKNEPGTSGGVSGGMSGGVSGGVVVRVRKEEEEEEEEDGGSVEPAQTAPASDAGETQSNLPHKKPHSLKMKIPRKALFACTPYSKLPVAFNGAHFHSELMDRKTMSVIRHTTHTLASCDLSSSVPCITLAAKIIGERRQVAREPEVLVRWSPQVIPDEWVYVSKLVTKKVVHFNELPPCQLSLLASKCFGFDKFRGRKSKRKP